MRKFMSQVLVLFTAVLLGAPLIRAQPADPAGNPPRDAGQTDIETLKREIDALRRQQDKLLLNQKEMEVEMEESEVSRADETEEAQGQKTFSIYGFFDINCQQWWVPQNGALQIIEEEFPKYPSFVFGNLNLYFDFNPLPSWRFLAEVRLLLNPIGDVESYESRFLGTTFRRVDATTTDPTNFGETFNFGSIEIERAQLEWTGLEWLNLTLGLFLTPYGIWNVDHGSPARMTVTAPFLYSSYVGAFPERQLGMKIHGTHLAGSVSLAYDLTLTNGRGVADTLKDSNWDKAVGGRFEAGYSGTWRWKAGLSVYTGEVTVSKKVLQIMPTPQKTSEMTFQYRELALGADLQIDAGPFLIQWEILVNWRNYDDEHRAPLLLDVKIDYIISEAFIAISNDYAPDRFCWGTYLQLSYRLPLAKINLRPFVHVGWVDFDDNTRTDNMLSTMIGINWRISGAVVLKADYSWGHWPNKDTGGSGISFSSGDIQRVAVQASVAF